MKILYILGHYVPHIGGVEMLFQEYAKGMKELGHEVRVVTSASGGIVGERQIDGVKVYGYKWKIFCGHPLVKSSDIVRHIQWADIVHTTTFTVAPPTLKICERYYKPCLITIHEVLGDKWYWIESNKAIAFGFKAFEKYVCCRPYNFIHFVSHSTMNDYFKYYGKCSNTKMIYNSIDEDLPILSKGSSVELKKVFSIPDDSKTFLYFGRPGKSKGIFVLLEAIKILYQSDEDSLNGFRFCFLISNDPKKEHDKFEREIEKSGLSNIVKTHDSVNRIDLFKIILDSDYVIVPSVTEGFGFSAAEACALQKKVIYSNGGSLPEVVSGEILEFENRNSADLAEKILSVIRNGDAVFAKTNYKKFKRAEMIQSMNLFYNEITNS